MACFLHSMHWIQSLSGGSSYISRQTGHKICFCFHYDFEFDLVFLDYGLFNSSIYLRFVCLPFLLLACLTACNSSNSFLYGDAVNSTDFFFFLRTLAALGGAFGSGFINFGEIKLVDVSGGAEACSVSQANFFWITKTQVVTFAKRVNPIFSGWFFVLVKCALTCFSRHIHEQGYQVLWVRVHRKF